MNEELASSDLVAVQGNVTVDLIDPLAGGKGSWRGKVIQREEGHNFLGKMWEERAKWEQQRLWTFLHPNVSLDTYGISYNAQPIFPAEFCAFWNDATAESASTERSVNKSLVGFASRWPVGSPTGKRGVVNLTESVFDSTGSKWVFDWTTSQGNGTFQSVGWTRVDPSFNGGEAMMVQWPEVGFVRVTPAVNGVYYSGGCAWDGTLFYSIVPSSASTSSATYRIQSFPAAGGNGTTVVNIPTSMAPAGINGGFRTRGLAKSGSDWYICGQEYLAASFRAYIGKMNSSGTELWSRLENSTSEFQYGNTIKYMDVTIDGSGYPWVIGDNAVMYKLSPTDGTIVTRVPLNLSTSATYEDACGIAWDSTDGNFWVNLSKGLVKVDSSGNLVGPAWAYGAAGYGGGYSSETATSPFSGTATWYASRVNETYTLTNAGLSQSTSEMFYTDWPSYIEGPSCYASYWVGGALVMKGGEPWGGYGVSTNSNGSSAYPSLLGITPMRGNNLASRMRLSSPVTKTSSNALKVTYTFTFS